MIQAAIFDMDGLLIDSEPIWVEAEMRVFGALGVQLTPAMCAETKGMRQNEVVLHWLKRRPWKGPSPDRVEKDVVAEVARLFREKGKALPGAVQAVEAAKTRCRAVGLASSSPMFLIEEALASLGIRDRFDVIHSAEREAFGKPHPAVYLSTAAKLGSDPSECLAFEDSVSGVLAAKSARLFCVAVPIASERADKRFGIADGILESLEQADGAFWDRWAKP